MYEKLLNAQYGLHLRNMRKSAVGAGSDTWLLDCQEGAFVLKFPAASSINHPEAEPALCAFLRDRGIPACDFLKNTQGEYLSCATDGRIFTVQRRLPGITPAWHSASEALLLESAALLGKIHCALRDYPSLPEGIGAQFFQHMLPQHAAGSYHRSLLTATERGDEQTARELRWRINLMQRLPAPDFDLTRLTLRNTHGDYFISQFLCENGCLSAVIDWTTACVHPVIWEIMRSFTYAAPACREGVIDRALLACYVEAYCHYGVLNDYDLQNMEKLYAYQIAVCDYYGQYYASDADNRAIYLAQAQLATRLLQRMYPNI